ncbi:reverse transcriptase domain-containing protein [Tanacetum coccineum]
MRCPDFGGVTDTYSEPSRTDSREPSHISGHSHRGHSHIRERSQTEDLPRGTEESYGNMYSQGTTTKYRNRSRNVKRWRESESPSSYGSENSTSNGGHWKSSTKRRKLADEDDLAEPWTCEDVDPRPKRPPKNIPSCGTGGALGNAYMVSYVQLYLDRSREGEAAAASKKKGHSSWKSQDHFKRHAPEQKSDFRSRDQIKNGKKEAPAKDKSLVIYMIQQWQRTTKQKLTQSFAYGGEITFPPLADSDGTEGPLVIEAEIGGHMIHRIYIDRGSSTEILYEHYFNQLRPEIRSQMVPTRSSLTGFSRETIWPLGQLRLLVTLGDADHCTKACMDFMIVRSISPYNGIIGRPGIREIQAVPSTAHRMLKFPADGGIVTIRSTILIPVECATVITSPKEIPKEAGTNHLNLKVAIHLNFPDQEVAIRGTLS